MQYFVRSSEDRIFTECYIKSLPKKKSKNDVKRRAEDEKEGKGVRKEHKIMKKFFCQNKNYHKNSHLSEHEWKRNAKRKNSHSRNTHTKGKEERAHEEYMCIMYLEAWNERKM